MDHNLLTILFAFGATLAWGIGDFCGGFASRQHNTYSVLLTAQLISVVPLLILVLLFEDTIPKKADLVFGGLGGLCGGIGVLNLYIGLAKGRMGIVAPLSAIIASAIPVLIGILVEGLPTYLQLGGFVLAFVAVWLLSTDGYRFDVTIAELHFATISGISFAAFFVCLDRVSGETGLWPILISRITSLIALSLYVVGCRQWHPPRRFLLLPIVLVGLLDTAGNYCFTMAAQMGQLAIATIVSCLYPVITILLALFILKERLKLTQWVGVLVAFMAIIMIAINNLNQLEMIKSFFNQYLSQAEGVS